MQIDLRGFDLSSLDVRKREKDLRYATFDTLTVWPTVLPADFHPRRIMELGKDPGLGVRGLHARGITGKGVGLAIIDQGLLVDHVEYRERLKLYEEIHSGDMSAAMHGPAVASIAVGKSVGVAPGADLYYIAETHGRLDGGTFLWDLASLAQSIDRIVEINAGLPKGSRIRVISISLGIATIANNRDMVMEAIRRAGEAGIYTVYVESDSFFGLGRAPSSDPDSFASCVPAIHLEELFFSSGSSPSKIGIPMDARCTASPTGANDYVFYADGGSSWTVPYVAGLFALACEVRPDVTPEVFWSAAERTGEVVDIVPEGRNYRLGKIVSPVRLMEYLSNTR
jgi:hypothetical protein